MRHVTLALAVVTVLAACDNAGPTSPVAPTTPNGPGASSTLGLLFPPKTYPGTTRAIALEATALGLTVKSGEAGPLPSPEGGSESNSALTAGLPNILYTSVLNGEVWANRYHSRASSSVDKLALNLAGLQLTAAVLAAESHADCTGEALGNASVASLTLNGKPIAITGLPNQTIPLLIGKVVINEQQPWNGGVRVRALHVVVYGIADVVVAEAASARLTC
jgi:hypothetical protein